MKSFLRSSGQAMPTWAPSWPWPLMTNGIRPARLRIHILSSTARARATLWYIARRSSSVRPTEAARSAPRLRVTAMAGRPPPRSEVDRAAVDGHGRLADDLGERRVGVGRAPDLPGRRVEGEGERRLGDEVGGVRADEVDAQRVVGLLVPDHLGEALVLAADDRLGDRLEGDLADLVGDALLLALLLGQADRGDLRAAVRRTRLPDVVDRVDVHLAGDHVGRHQPLVGGRVGEQEPADDVADGVQVGLLRPHPPVDLDEAAVQLRL